MKTDTLEIPNIQSISLEEKIAQMIMIDFSGDELDRETLDHIRSKPWSGFILFAKNVSTRDKLLDLNHKLMNMGYRIPPFISLDQEGGLVNRVEFEGMNLSPGNMALGRIDDAKITENTAFVSGVELRELGFHLNFSPVVDVNINPDNPIIGVRSFGEDTDLVCRMGEATIRGYEKAGIAGCAKHFPGHGDTSFDSHLSLASVNADIQRIESVELPPFETAVRAGVPSVMTAHVLFPAVDPHLPATLSKKILTGILREKMGFEGLIITDSMSMKAIADHFGIGQAAVMTVKAGADIVMMCAPFEDQLTAFNAIKEAVRSGEIGMETIDRAVGRIFAFKDKYVVNPPNIPILSESKRKKIIGEASSKAVNILYDHMGIFSNKKPMEKVLILSPDRLYQTLLGEKSEQWSVYPYLNNRFSHIERKTYHLADPETDWSAGSEIGSYDMVLFEIYSRGAMKEGEQRAAEKVIGRCRDAGVPVVIISLSSHYGLPQTADAALTAYNYLPPAMSAIADLMENA